VHPDHRGSLYTNYTESRIKFLYLIRGVSKDFFFLRLYTALLNVAKKKRNFNIGEEHKRKNRRYEETEKRKSTTRKKTEKKR
jgi:hypothetical protein